MQQNQFYKQPQQMRSQAALNNAGQASFDAPLLAPEQQRMVVSNRSPQLQVTSGNFLSPQLPSQPQVQYFQSATSGQTFEPSMAPTEPLAFFQMPPPMQYAQDEYFNFHRFQPHAGPQNTF